MFSLSIAHHLSFLDLYRFSTVNLQAYDRLYKSQNYWKSRAQCLTGEMPEVQYDRNMYMGRFLIHQKIDYTDHQFTVSDICGTFSQVHYTSSYKATIDFHGTLHVESKHFANDEAVRKKMWPYFSMVNVKSIIGEDNHMLIQTRDRKLYVAGGHPFTNENVIHRPFFDDPTIILENVTKVNFTSQNTIIWKDSKIYKTNFSQRTLGQYLTNTVFEPVKISAKDVLVVWNGDIIFINTKGQLYWRQQDSSKRLICISENVRSIYLQQPFVYWISVNGVLWQAKLNELIPKYRMMTGVRKISCAKEHLWILTLDSKLYHIQSNTLPTNMKNIRFVCDDVWDVDAHNNFAIVKKVR